MSADAQPRRLTATQAFLDALADVQVTVEQHVALAERLHRILEPQQAPGSLHPIKLNSDRPYSDAAADHGSKSFTVLNPSGMAVALGTGGVGASNVAAITVPPRSAITLPITAENLEVGPDTPADLQAGGLIGAGVDVYVFVITYRHVQPFYFGAWAG
jgi:hypothetical protein